MCINKINKLPLLFFVVLLIGCQKEEIMQEVVNPQLDEIQFTVSTSPLSVTTRASLTTNEIFKDKPFGLFGFVHKDPIKANDNINTIGVKIFNNAKFSYQKGCWTSPSSSYWSDSLYSFYSYHPYEEVEYEVPGSPESGIYVYTENGNLYLQYHPNRDCLKQPDLMISAMINTKKPTLEAPLNNLDFYHALAAVGFKISGSNQEVTSISITKIRTPGYLRPENIGLDGSGKPIITWEYGNNYYTSSTSAEKDLLDPHSKGFIVDKEGKLVIGTNGYMMILPQTLPADATIELVVNGNKREINIGGQILKAGEKILFNLDLPIKIQDFTTFVNSIPTDRIWFPYGDPVSNGITNETWVISDTSPVGWRLNNLISTLKELSRLQPGTRVQLMLDDIPFFEGQWWMGNNSVESVSMTNAAKIAKGMFANSVNLKSVNSPGITEFPEQAYSGCTALETIDNLDNITMIDNAAFSYCRALVKDIVIKNVNRIGKLAFTYSGIKTLTASFKVQSGPIKNNVVDSLAFSGCENLKIVKLTNVDSLNRGAFEGCNSLTTIDAKTVKYIGDKVFTNCVSVAEFNFPEIHEIGEEAFAYCFPRTSSAAYSLVLGVATDKSALILGDCLFGFSLIENKKIPITNIDNVDLIISKVGKVSVDNPDGSTTTITTAIDANNLIVLKSKKNADLTTTSVETKYQFKSIKLIGTLR